MKKIDDILENAGVHSLRRQAARHAELGQLLRAELPAWLDGEDLAFELAPDGVLYLNAPRAQLRQLKQLLPALRRKLQASAGIRQLRLASRPPAA